MSFGQNLQFLRKMHHQMTQEELAEKLGVTRQTISKWEQDLTYPEISNVLELCNLFSCSMDQLILGDMNISDDETYSDIRIRWVEPLRYVRYTVVSTAPKEDAIRHAEGWAKQLGIKDPEIIGWDFPVPSQELINVHNMHGYTAALLLPENVCTAELGEEIITQERQKYLSITIWEPERAPYRIIPDAYRLLLAYAKTNGFREKRGKDLISCFEKEYEQDGAQYMDVSVIVE